jgi:hypothetical protein
MALIHDKNYIKLLYMQDTKGSILFLGSTQSCTEKYSGKFRTAKIKRLPINEPLPFRFGFRSYTQIERNGCHIHKNNNKLTHITAKNEKILSTCTSYKVSLETWFHRVHTLNMNQ